MLLQRRGGQGGLRASIPSHVTRMFAAALPAQASAFAAEVRPVKLSFGQQRAGIGRRDQPDARVIQRGQRRGIGIRIRTGGDRRNLQPLSALREKVLHCVPQQIGATIGRCRCRPGTCELRRTAQRRVRRRDIGERDRDSNKSCRIGVERDNRRRQRAVLGDIDSGGNKGRHARVSAASAWAAPPG